MPTRLAPLDKHVITPVVKWITTPIVGAVASLPASESRDGDACAWRELLAATPTRLTSLAIRIAALDLALEGLDGLGAADTLMAYQYDPAFVDFLTKAGYDTSAMHGVVEVPAQASVLSQVTLAAAPLKASVKGAKAGSAKEAIQSLKDVAAAGRETMSELPPQVGVPLSAGAELAPRRRAPKSDAPLTFTAF